MQRIVPVVFLVTVACQQRPGLEKRAPDPDVPVPKQVEVVRFDADVGIEASGTALPAREAVLSASVPGRITEIPVILGQKVAKGQALVRLDPYGFSLGVQQAEAGLAAATVQADQAQRELERAQRLVDAKVAPGATFEQVRAAYQAAVAQKQVAEAGLKQAQKALGDSTVRSPFDGTVDAILKEVGEYAPSMPPTMLIKVVDVSSLEIQLFLPESRAGQVSAGMPAHVRIDSAGTEATGEVVFVSNRVQPGTQTFEVRVQIPNPDETTKAGAFARVTLGDPVAAGAVIVPRRAVQKQDDGAFVWVVDSGSARRVAVTLGDASNGNVAITGGLDRGRPVIVSDLSGLADGDPVVSELN